MAFRQMTMGCAVSMVAWAALTLASSADGPDDAAVARGKVFVEAHCARCHAIGTAGDSTHSDAPPFRTLEQRYPVENLAESLAEGIMVGHSDMPRFTLEADEVGDVLAYLKSIQERGAR